MSALPIASAFNDGYVAEAYERYRRDPSAVDESWRQFFRFAESLAGGGATGAFDETLLRKAAGAAALALAVAQAQEATRPVLAVLVVPTVMYGAPRMHRLAMWLMMESRASAITTSASFSTSMMRLGFWWSAMKR